MQGLQRDGVVRDRDGDVEHRLCAGLGGEHGQVGADGDARVAGVFGTGPGGVEVEVDDADQFDVGVGCDGAEPSPTHAPGADLQDAERGHACAPAWPSTGASPTAASSTGASSTGASSNGPR